MNDIMSSFRWANDGISPISVTQEYILPPEKRPNLTAVTSSQSISIPIIDMNNENEMTLVHEIAKACEEFGFFVLINHEKSQLLSNRIMVDGKIYRHHLIDPVTKKEVGMWSETLFHTWHPVEVGFIQKLLQNPSHFRETIASYAKEIGPLMDRLLSLISQGFGLSKDYLQTRLEENLQYTAQANYSPPSPNPELTLGLQPHSDKKVLSIILQDQGITGLHVLKDQQWIAIDPIPASLFVNVADYLQVLSNDKYTSVYHRAVNNNVKERASYTTFCGLNKVGIISLIQELIDLQHPPLHPKYYYGDFLKFYRQKQNTITQKLFSGQTTTSSLSLTKFTHPPIFRHPKLNFLIPKKSKLLIPFYHAPTLSFPLSPIF
ncbi:Protein DMR6-LIKE OXYGENASE 1 [Bienertia sinuspersici]